MGLRILVVGAGAIGGLFGMRLAKAGRDVSFLVRPARAEALRAEGLVLEAPDGKIALQPNLLTTAELKQPFDVVLLCVKAFVLESALADIVAAVGPGTMILPLLNGLAHIERIRARFGAGPLIGGICRAVVQLDDAGHIRQAAAMQQIAYGELDGSVTPRLERLDADFQVPGLQSTLSSHIEQDLWDKWVQLASLGAVTCLLGGTIGEVAAKPYGAQTALAILEECISIAKACGHPSAETYLESNRELIVQVGSAMTSSMYRDKAARQPVEAEQILGDLIRRAAAVGVQAPLLKAAFVALQNYQAGLSRKG
jgi:2-dehydropantoate 2-reductase